MGSSRKQVPAFDRKGEWQGCLQPASQDAPDTRKRRRQEKKSSAQRKEGRGGARNGQDGQGYRTSPISVSEGLKIGKEWMYGAREGNKKIKNKNWGKGHPALDLGLGVCPYALQRYGRFVGVVVCYMVDWCNNFVTEFVKNLQFFTMESIWVRFRAIQRRFWCKISQSIYKPV